MMTTYILKLIFLVPLVAGMAYGALWLCGRSSPGWPSPRAKSW